MTEALLGVAFENLLSLVQNLIKVVLEDVEHKQVSDRSIKIWLQQIKDDIYVLDDILDECLIESGRIRGSSSFKPKNIVFRHEINRLKEITRRLDKIAENKNKFHLREDKDKIVKFLLTQARDTDFLSIYPIVGLGGIGKTTIVRLIHDDIRVSGNFNIIIWVCVYETFSLNRIVCSIIEPIIREKWDVWNKNQKLEFGLCQEKWNMLKYVLSCVSKGSFIFASTPDEVVMADGFISSRRNLEVLDVASMAWNGLCQKPFFEDIKIYEYSKDISLKTRDLFNDLAQSILEQQYMYLENANMTSLTKSTHHISFDSNNLLSIDDGAFKKVESLRTLYDL
ncbi:NB-ARC domain disease resistance protein [Medicago truncatula]|uniref:NB-ARC domain disease resistance protein n=1 Tax=Medicago truncatula TaxID=3880 RepID=G7JZK8_MEDTR|nr:NB-ARC domain disease resistance protein [Medicago truncatula]